MFVSQKIKDEIKRYHVNSYPSEYLSYLSLKSELNHEILRHVTGSSITAFLAVCLFASGLTNADKTIKWLEVIVALASTGSCIYELEIATLFYNFRKENKENYENVSKAKTKK